jgi:aromatic ring-cleaving dioxygenase
MPYGEKVAWKITADNLEEGLERIGDLVGAMSVATQAAPRRSRIDADGLAFAGSMLQTQLYVNRRADELDQAILRELPDLAALDPRVVWVSPLKEAGYKEFWDAAFLRELGFPGLAGRIGEWWPSRGGPHWDALARLEFADGRSGVLLVEGKSYPGEMYDKAGCSATSARSLAKIEAALVATQIWLGVDQPVETWMRPLYQTANRLATLKWLMDNLDDRAWLVHLCFVDDRTHPERMRASQEEWEQALGVASAQLGIKQRVPHYAHVFLDGLERL